jgi:hypothetical protein
MVRDFGDRSEEPGEPYINALGERRPDDAFENNSLLTEEQHARLLKMHGQTGRSVISARGMGYVLGTPGQDLIAFGDHKQAEPAFPRGRGCARLRMAFALSRYCAAFAVNGLWEVLGMARLVSAGITSR